MKLTNIEMFRGLSKIELAKLLGMMEKQVAPPGTILFEQGDHGDSMYIIESGAIELFICKEDSVRQSLVVLGEGDVVGEMAMLTGEPRSASAIVAEAGVLYRIDQAVFELIVAQNAVFSAYFIRLLSQRLILTNDRLQGARVMETERVTRELHKLSEPMSRLILWSAQLPVATRALVESTFGIVLVEERHANRFLQETVIPDGSDEERFVVAPQYRQILNDLAKERYGYDELRRWIEDAIHWYIRHEDWFNAMTLQAELGDWPAALELCVQARKYASAVQLTELLQLLSRCPQQRLAENYSALQCLLQLCSQSKLVEAGAATSLPQVASASQATSVPQMASAQQMAGMLEVASTQQSARKSQVKSAQQAVSMPQSANVQQAKSVLQEASAHQAASVSQVASAPHAAEALKVERASLGLSALEAALQVPERYTPAQRLQLYEHGMELAHAAGEQRLALRYSQLAERQASLPEDGADPTRAYGLARQKLTRAKSTQLARSAGRLLKGNRPAELGAVTAAMLCIIAAFVLPPAWGLSAAGVKFLGLAVAAVILWIAAVVPDYIVALGMVMLWVLGGVATPETALSGFASTSWLFMVCIMAFSAVIMKSGISYRFALHALKRFPRSYRGQLWGIVAGGILMNPLLPSSSAKVSLGVPMAQTLAESMGFGERSRGSSGLGLVAMIFFGFTAPFVMTGSYTNIMAYGLAASEQSVSWLQWLLYALPAFLLFGGIMLIGLLIAFRKVEPVRMVEAEVLDEQLGLLGPLTKDERVALWTILACIILMMLEPLHGVASTWIMLGGFAVLVTSGVLDKQTMASGIDWTFLLFLGAAFSFAGVAQELAIAEWLSSLLSTQLSVLADSQALFLVAVVLVSFVVTLVIRDDPAVILLVTAIVPLGAALGIHPWVLVFLILLATDPFFFAYQSPTYLTAYYTSEGKSFTHRQAQRTALLYGAAVLLVAVLCTPYWKWLGLMNE